MKCEECGSKATRDIRGAFLLFGCGSKRMAFDGSFVVGVDCLTRQLAAKSAECERLKQTIETMKANERERYASAAKALGVVAPCDRAALLNEKGGE